MKGTIWCIPCRKWVTTAHTCPHPRPEGYYQVSESPQPLTFSRRIELLRETLREIEDAYDDRADEKLDFEQVRERAGWALEIDDKMAKRR